jgi:zinc/manganese transport system substrate-binding protein
VVTVTETMSPASATFEQWQTAQLQSLAGALAAATHR